MKFQILVFIFLLQQVFLKHVISRSLKNDLKNIQQIYMEKIQDRCKTYIISITYLLYYLLVKQYEQITRFSLCKTEKDCKKEFENLLKKTLLERKSQQEYLQKTRKPFYWG